MKTATSSKKRMVLVTVLVPAAAILIGAAFFLIPKYCVPAADPTGPLLPDTGLWLTREDLFVPEEPDEPLSGRERIAELQQLVHFLS